MDEITELLASEGRPMSKGKMHCMFCRKSEDEVKRLVAGASHRAPDNQPLELVPFAICDECLGNLVSIMGEIDKEWRARQIEVLKGFNTD